MFDLMVREIILAKFRKLGVKMVGADGGVDLTLGNDDPTGKFVPQILAAVSEWEKRLIVQKLRASRLRIRRSGQRCEGGKPFGQTPEERAVIEKMLAWRKEHLSFAEIAAKLNEEGIPTRTGEGAKWHPTQVQRIVKRSRAVGSSPQEAERLAARAREGSPALSPSHPGWLGQGGHGGQAAGPDRGQVDPGEDQGLG